MSHQSNTYDTHPLANEHLYGAFDHEEQHISYDLNNGDRWPQTDATVDPADLQWTETIHSTHQP